MCSKPRVLWWEVWHWDGIFFGNIRFVLSLSSHTHIHLYVALNEDIRLLKAIFFGYRGALDRSILSFLLVLRMLVLKGTYQFLQKVRIDHFY